MRAFKSKNKSGLTCWPNARQITAAESHTEGLPIGWYIYEEGFGYCGLRPNPQDQTVMERSSWYHMHRVDQLVQWLGVPLPPQFRSEDGSAQRLENDAPPSAESTRQLEHDWAEQRMLRELREPQKKKAAVRKRSQMVRFMLSEEEQAFFLNRVKSAGMTQAAFLREAALHGRITVYERNPELIHSIQKLTSELGRQGGLLKMWVKPNEGQRILNPEEWNHLVEAVNYIESVKPKLEKIMENLNGHH